jgi:hypothetical protein
MAYKTASNQGGIVTDVAKKTSPSSKPYLWEIQGNLRDYDSAIDTRIDNYTQLNPNIASESGKSQYRLGLRLFFNPAANAGKNVQAVRVKGPGLPAAGITMHRSSACGTNDYMTITSKVGNLIFGGNSILWNSATTNNFRLASELKTGVIDWSKVSGLSGWRDAPMTDAEISSIPPFAEYTFELWNFGAVTGGGFSYRTDITNTTTPDVTYKQRLASKPPVPSSLKHFTWNTLNTNGFLNPQDALAASAASVSASWTQMAEPVDMLTAFGQKAVANATTTANNYSNLRVSADTSGVGVSLNARTAAVSPINDPSGTAGLSGIVGVVPNIPNCAGISFPALDAVAGTNPIGADSVARANVTYRELILRSRTPYLLRKYSIAAWSNFSD